MQDEKEDSDITLQEPTNLSSAGWLDKNSPLTANIENFKPRIAQQMLASAIETAITNQTNLVAEAATGVGKTFAYLVPVLLSRKKAIISTGTKTLQDQLFFRDLPRIRSALGIPAKVALLKGRNNYICRHHLERNLQTATFSTRTTLMEVQQIRKELSHSKTGDINEFTSIPENSEAWPYVTSTVENCLGQECSYYQDCFLVKARRKALEADVVIVNHHLFFADLNLKQDEWGELLPHAQVIILDEAHQIPEIAAIYFGKHLSSRQLLTLIHDIEVEQLTDAKDMPALTEEAQHLEKSVRDLRLALGVNNQRAPWHRLKNSKEVGEAITQIQENLASLEILLTMASKRSKGLEYCYQRFLELKHLFLLLTESTQSAMIHWYETFTHNFILHHTPQNIAESFKIYLDKMECSWIFTSATLSVEGEFKHFTDQLGLETALTLQLPSVFNYEEQGLLYVPRYLPESHQPHFTAAMIEAAIPLIQACQGRTFILFTSHAALKEAAVLLADRLNFPLLIQGQKGKDKLLQQFCELGNAVLLGTNSFWEGVDVRGQQLSCVIIDKLPFAVPDDPIFEARINLLKQQGREPFADYQLPTAVIALKQGAGRLIRDISDRGVLMITDSRLVSRNFGATFLKSLPPMRRTREAAEAIEFLEAII